MPREIDLREDWWPVADQGSTGSCVGWASGDSVIRWHMTKAGLIDQDERISVRYLWMASKEMDEFTRFPTTFIENEGTSLKSALEVARKFGVVLEDVLPFGGGSLYPNDMETFFTIAARRKIVSYYNLKTDQGAWREWLANHGPILTRLIVDSTWYEAAATKGNLDVYKPETACGGHAIALVGYRADGSFIVRNSWGEAWGDKGFAYASEAYAKDAFTEAYGVAV